MVRAACPSLDRRGRACVMVQPHRQAVTRFESAHEFEVLPAEVRGESHLARDGVNRPRCAYTDRRGPRVQQSCIADRRVDQLTREEASPRQPSASRATASATTGRAAPRAPAARRGPTPLGSRSVDSWCASPRAGAHITRYLEPARCSTYARTKSRSAIVVAADRDGMNTATAVVIAHGYLCVYTPIVVVKLPPYSVRRLESRVAEVLLQVSAARARSAAEV